MASFKQCTLEKLKVNVTLKQQEFNVLRAVSADNNKYNSSFTYWIWEKFAVLNTPVYDDMPCLKTIISKCLGFGIILGSVLVKLPQILKMMSAKSGEGISFLSVLFELIAVSANVAYSFNHNFPFSSYGEGVFLALQTSLVLFLVLFYHGQLFQSFMFVVVYGGVMAYLLSPMAPVPLITTAQTLNIFIVIASKLLQVSANYKNGSTGQLSAITQVLLFLGSVARIFTTLQETGDQLTVVMYIISATCNFLLVAQLVYYWDSDHKKKGKKKE